MFLFSIIFMWNNKRTHQFTISITYKYTDICCPLLNGKCLAVLEYGNIVCIAQCGTGVRTFQFTQHTSHIPFEKHRKTIKCVLNSKYRTGLVFHAIPHHSTAISYFKETVSITNALQMTVAISLSLHNVRSHTLTLYTHKQQYVVAILAHFPLLPNVNSILNTFHSTLRSFSCSVSIPLDFSLLYQT